MKRKIVVINEEKCNGCGLCVDACHEGALQLIDGKAKLISESYCDGLGDCLPECPVGAITIEEREAAAYDEASVKMNMEKNKAPVTNEPPLACGCPGTAAKTLRPQTPAPPVDPATKPVISSQLRQWPCQLKLVPVNAPYFHEANLLIAADCTAYAYANFHQDFMRNKVTLIGCPKLDQTEYSEKIAEILTANEIKSITILRMEVPCCGGLANAVKMALMKSGKLIPWQIITIGTDGTILEQ
mgnify:CR=1 FL=1